MDWSDTIHLKFADEAEWLAAQEAAAVNDGSQIALDVVGVLFRDDDFSTLEGWHVNVRLRGIELPDAYQSHVIPTPAHPKRVFA